MRKGVGKALRLLFTTLFISLILSYFTQDAGRQLLHCANHFLTGKTYAPTIEGVDGVPWVDYGVRGGKRIGLKRNASRVGDIGLNHLDQYKLFGDTIDLQKARNCLDWLRQNAVPLGRGVGYHSGFGRTRYHIDSSFRSTLFQAKTVRLGAAFFEIQPDLQLADFIHNILLAFTLPVDSGGITYKESKHEWWYEEYATEKSDRPWVLNGMITTLISLHEYYQVTNDSLALELFQKGYASLRNHLPQYDRLGFSLYDKLGHSPELVYHNAHWKLLTQLNQVVDDPVLQLYATKWKRGRRYPLFLRAILVPNRLEIVNSLLHWWVMLNLSLLGQWVFKNRKRVLLRRVLVREPMPKS